MKHGTDPAVVATTNHEHAQGYAEPHNGNWHKPAFQPKLSPGNDSRDHVLIGLIDEEGFPLEVFVMVATHIKVLVHVCE